MIALQEEQMEKFKGNALQSFVVKMMQHSHEFSPYLCDVLGDKQLRYAVEEGIANAKKYGFTYKGSVQLYLDLTFMFGSYFDKDPLFNEFAVILHDDSNQMFRAEQIHILLNTYLEKVHGVKNQNINQALLSLIHLLESPFPQSKENFDVAIIKEFKAIFPQRAAYVGDDALDEFIQIARGQAADFNLPPVSGTALMVVLMSAFGSGRTNDKPYPWISKTLIAEKVQDTHTRVER